MSIRWAEFRGQCAPAIRRAWAAMTDVEPMAIGSVFEMKDGAFKAVYSIAGQVVPTVDGPYLSLADAQRRVEFASATRILRPRPVLLDSGFM